MSKEDTRLGLRPCELTLTISSTKCITWRKGVLSREWGARPSAIVSTIEGLHKSAALDGYDLDAAVKNLLKTVEVAKRETEHDHR